MNKISLTFRDFAAHMVPGFVALIALVLVDASLQSWADANKASAAVVLLVGGYCLGFLLDALCHEPALKVVRMFPWWKDPMPATWDKAYAHAGFGAQARELLEAHVGTSHFNAEGRNARIYFCVRYIESRSDRAADLIDRITSLQNLAINLIVPVLCLVAACLYRDLWVAAGVSTAVVIALPFKNCQDRDWLGRTVLRYYAILRKAELQGGGNDDTVQRRGRSSYLASARRSSRR